MGRSADAIAPAQLRPNLDIYALGTLRMPQHVRRFAVCAWLQARAWHVRDERHLRARRWVHQFGYGGHYLTKSRRYSATFGKLRQARRDWHLTRQRAARARDAERRITSLAHREPVAHIQADDHTDSAADPERFVLAMTWRLDGIGWRTVGDALLAQTARTQALNARLHLVPVLGKGKVKLATLTPMHVAQQLDESDGADLQI